MGGATAPKAVSVPMPFAAAIVCGALSRCIARPLLVLKALRRRRRSRSLAVPGGRVVLGSVPTEPLEEPDERGLYAAQLLQMRAGHAAQDALGLGRERQQRAPAVALVREAHEEPLLGQAVGELARAVVRDQELARQLAHRHPVAARVALDGEQRLVLLRGQPRRLGDPLAEREEPPQLAPEGGEQLVVGLPQAHRARPVVFRTGYLARACMIRASTRRDWEFHRITIYLLVQDAAGIGGRHPPRSADRR